MFGRSFVSILAVLFLIFLVEDIFASSFDFKIPFPKGEKWKVTQGYEGSGWVGSNPTHNISNKDRYAIDFSLPGEEDYGKIVLATTDGVAYVKEQIVIDKITGQKNFTGYGQYIDIDHGNGLISRYAHLLSYSITNGQEVKQGQEIGRVDNTGYKGGSHLHFAIYQKDANGKLTPHKPEPMSGITGFTAGQWYTSDNELYDPNQKPPKPEPQTSSQTQPQPQSKTSLWSKILNFFSPLFVSEDNTVKTEQTPALKTVDNSNQITDNSQQITDSNQPSPTYQLQFVNSGQILTGKPGEVLNLKAEVKNTGAAVWKKSNISANVVGGSTANIQFYHSSWLTYLRPTLLQENEVASGGTGTFSFTINTPEQAGDYQFRIQAVRTEAGFAQIEGGFWALAIAVEEAVKEKEEKADVGETTGPQTAEPIKKIGEKTVDAVKEVVEKAVDTAKQVFNYGYSGGGGGSGTQADADLTQNVVEDVEEEIEEEEVEEVIEEELEEEETEEIEEIIEEEENLEEEGEESEEELPEEDEEEVEEVEENEEESVELEEEVDEEADVVPPEIPIIIVSQSEFATPTLFVSWNSVDASNYDAQYKISSGEWLDFVTNTTSTDGEMIVERWQDYFFRARAYDESGNASDWGLSQTFIPDWPRTVVINEVAWMGNGPDRACPKQEWLELFNPGDQAVDLTDWKLEIEGWGEITLSSILSPNDFYLIVNQYTWYLKETLALGDIDIDRAVPGLSLPDTGSRLILKNKDGEIIDEVDASAGWFAGSAGAQYRSMERITFRQSGSRVDNWQTNRSLPLRGRGNNCGPLYGTPRQPNHNYWLLSGNLGSNYSSLITEDGILILKRENSPYIFDTEVEIPEGYTVRVEPGVVLYGRNKNAYFKVSGSLEFLGTAEEPVVVTSALDKNYLENNLLDLSGEAAPGDWSRIEIQSGGEFKAEHTKFFYGGRNFYQSSGWVYGKFLAQVIRNLGGVVELNYTEFYNNFITHSDRGYNSIIWTEAPNGYDATTTIANSIFSGGWIAIKNSRRDNGQKISFSLKNSTLENLQSPDGPLVSLKDFPELENNVFSNNAQAYINLGDWTLATSTVLYPENNYVFGSIYIPPGLSLTVRPGASLRMKSGNIIVDGVLSLLGEAGNPITIQVQDYYNWGWGRIIFNNTSSTWRYVNLNGGSKNSDMNNGVVVGNDSVLDFSQVNFINVRRPYNALYLKNSTTTIRDSAIVWPTQYTGSQTVYGIKLKGGNLLLDGVDFNNMGVGVGVFDGGMVEMRNMSEDNFQNIRYYNWQPPWAWSFATST